MEENSSNSIESYEAMIRVLKDRCSLLQNRISNLEEENRDLKINNTSCRMDNLPLDFKEKEIIRLTEESTYTKATLQMVLSENNKLWLLLKKLSKGNVNLSKKLEKIKQSLSQHDDKLHLPLIRSKTFTQESPQTKKNLPTVIAEDEKISLEYEDISLKLQNSISKLELEWQSDEVIINSTLECDNDEVDDLFTADEVEAHLINLEAIKVNALMQSEQLKLLRDLTLSICREPCKMCDKLQEKLSDALQNQSNNLLDSLNDKTDAVCPMCEKEFKKEDFDAFMAHVENHFVCTKHR